MYDDQDQWNQRDIIYGITRRGDQWRIGKQESNKYYNNYDFGGYGWEIRKEESQTERQEERDRSEKLPVKQLPEEILLKRKLEPESLITFILSVPSSCHHDDCSYQII